MKSSIKKLFRVPGVKLAAKGLLRLIDLLRIARLRRSNVGSGSYLAPSVHVLGWRNTIIGRNSVISEGVSININQRDVPGAGVVIGNHCYIGRRNFFTCGKTIVLKDYCLTGLDCHFNGSDHIISDPFRPYVATGATNDSSIVLGVNCWLGTDVIIIGNVSIGHGSIVGAGSLVTKSAPPFSLLVGSPARIIKRFDMRSRSWIPASEFLPQMEREIPDEDSYLSLLKRNAPGIGMPVAAAGKAMGDLP